MRTTQYVRLEKQIAVGGRDDVVRRWRYGRQMLTDRAGRKQLPDGFVAARIKEAEKVDSKLSEREIQYRLRCAEAYPTEAEVRTAVRTSGSWTALRDAGFPPVEHAGSDPDDIAALGLGDAPDSWEQLQLDIPGLKQVLKVRGRAVPLVKGEQGAKVADVAAYVDMIEQMHNNFGKTVDAARESLTTMRAGCGGDEAANAVEAWEAGIGIGDSDDESEAATPMSDSPTTGDLAENGPRPAVSLQSGSSFSQVTHRGEA